MNSQPSGLLHALATLLGRSVLRKIYILPALSTVSQGLFQSKGLVMGSETLNGQTKRRRQQRNDHFSSAVEFCKVGTAKVSHPYGKQLVRRTGRPFLSAVYNLFFRAFKIRQTQPN